MAQPLLSERLRRHAGHVGGDGARDCRRSRLAEHTLRSAALHAAATLLPLVPSILTGALHVRRRIAGVLVVLVTLAVIRRGRGCFAAAAVAIAQVPHHHAERLRRRACHARGPGPASTGIVDLLSSPRRGMVSSVLARPLRAQRFL